MKIIEYKMAWAQHPEDLERNVAELLKQGYEVFGGPQCPASGPFAQCMVKRESPSLPEAEPSGLPEAVRQRRRHGKFRASTDKLIEDMV